MLQDDLSILQQLLPSSSVSKNKSDPRNNAEWIVKGRTPVSAFLKKGSLFLQSCSFVLTSSLHSWLKTSSCHRWGHRTRFSPMKELCLYVDLLTHSVVRTREDWDSIREPHKTTLWSKFRPGSFHSKRRHVRKKSLLLSPSWQDCAWANGRARNPMFAKTVKHRRKSWLSASNAIEGFQTDRDIPLFFKNARVRKLARYEVQPEEAKTQRGDAGHRWLWRRQKILEPKALTCWLETENWSPLLRLEPWSPANMISLTTHHLPLLRALTNLRKVVIAVSSSVSSNLDSYLVVF